MQQTSKGNFMKAIVVFILAATPVFVSADTITCTFTEPFVTSSYNTETATLEYTDYQGLIAVVENVSFKIVGAGSFELVKDGQVIQHLELNYQGSNGMSDHVYPYDVKDNREATHEGWGGCESDSLKAKLP